MKVVTDEGTTYMVHYTDKIEIISWEEVSSKTEADSQLRDAAERFLDAMASTDSKPDACNHDFGGWRDFEDGNGGEQVCKKCGMGAMSHTLSLDF